MIPKKIHYIWLGGGNKSKLTEMCINSWKRVLPDYKITEWNETNIDLDGLCKKNRFLSYCCKYRLWAFVSDYLRLYILLREGGIYLDTDVEVIKSFNPLLESNAFMGYEKFKGREHIGSSIIASEQGNPLIKRLLDYYEEEIWDTETIVNPYIFQEVLENEPAIFQNCMIYPRRFFSPYSPLETYAGTVENEETYSIHWFTGSWNMTRKGYVFLQTKSIKNPLVKFFTGIRKNIGFLRKRKKEF